jgi:hypothetical protein
MAKHSPVQQDALSNTLTAREIHIGNGVGDEKITIERLQVHLDQPSGVGLSPSRVHALSTVRRRRPLYLLPPRPATFINRSTELETLYQALSGFKTIDLYGPDGAGKSALMAALIHALDLSYFPDGAVFVTGRIQHQDLLQVLFECFYESDSPVKITPQHAPSYLNNLRALVILDDVGLGPKQIDPILDALGNAAVLIADTERTAVGRAHPLPLEELPRPEAITLFEKTLGRTPTRDEGAVIEQICATLNDMPLPISCMAMLAAQDKGSLLKLSADLRGRKPWAGPGGDLSVGPSLEQIVLALDAAERRLLTLVSAFASPSASSEALRTLLNLSTSELKAHAGRLQELGLLYTVGTKARRKPTRLALPPAYRRAVQTWLVDAAARQDIASYYVSRLGRGDQLEGEELLNLMGVIENCAQNGWLDALKLLVHAASRNLAALGWWAEWEHVLDLTRRAAQAEGDRTLEAWAMHQLGSLLGALGVSSRGWNANSERGFHMLQTAWNIRQALGDEDGAALSVRNLEVLDYLLPAPTWETAPEPLRAPPDGDLQVGKSLVPVTRKDEATAPSPERASRAACLKVGLTTLAVLAALAIGAFGVWFTLIRDGGGNDASALAVSWEFGDAWNTYDNKTWTQQIIVVVKGDASETGEYHYFVNGEPVGEMFEIILPICDGAQGTITVESDDGQTAQTAYEFVSPFCR